MKNPDSIEADLFTEAFGDGKTRKGDPEKSSAVMDKFLEENPDGKTKPGVARGKDFNIPSVVHSRGFRKEKGSESKNKMWDFEIFAGKMKADRAWDHTRAQAEWQLLKADPDLEKDALQERTTPYLNGAFFRH